MRTPFRWPVMLVIGVAMAFGTQVQAQSNPPGPPATAEDISRAVLKLIESLKTNRDITPERVEKFTGVRLISPVESTSEWTDSSGKKHIQHSSDPSGAAASGKLSPPWLYHLQIYRYPPEKTHARFDLSFVPGTTANLDTADMTPVCAFDLDAHAAAFKDMGFKESIIYGAHGSRRGKMFSRGEINVHLYPGGRPNAAGRACVWMINVE